MNKGRFGKVLILIAALLLCALVFSACELSDPDRGNKYYINDNEFNKVNNVSSEDKNSAINHVTDGITNLRKYLDSDVVSSTGYYMGLEFNVDTLDPDTDEGGNFRLKIQAHLFTFKYENDDGTPVNRFYDESDGQIYDEQKYDENGKPTRLTAEEYHNKLIKKSDILIEWYNGTTNEMLIGFYFDGQNDGAEDDGNVLYLNLQGAKRSFDKFGDTVLYRQLIRLLMNLSVEKLLTAGNLQGDAGVGSLQNIFQMAVRDTGYKVVINGDVWSTLFERLNGTDMLAPNFTDIIQGLFSPFGNKIDPFTSKYLGFAFSVVGSAVIQSLASDMQFFTGPDPVASTEIMTGAYMAFSGTALSDERVYNYVSDISFDYGLYPPDDMKLDRDFYVPYEYGQYEFTGNLYIPLINSNFDALIRTDMQQYDNSTNNVFMEFRDIANGELMIGAYYRNERSYIDISGLEYLYGWIDLNELGFPKVYDESLNLAELLASMFKGINDGIVSIVDSILSPNSNDKENHLLEYIMANITPHFKDPNDVFTYNGETLLVDMQLIKDFLRETGNGTYTTRQIINNLDSMLPYTMDQIAIMLGVPSAEVMLDNSYFNITWNVDTNEIIIELFTNVGVKEGESSTLIFQLSLIPVVVGQKVNIANINFEPFKPLQDIYTYSATMDGNFYFSAAETVDLSKLLSATIAENSGLNTQYQLESNAGLTFELVYDQFVKDPPDYTGKNRAGRSAFELNVWLIVNENKQIATSGDYADNWTKSGLVISLASDDVAFNNEVYNDPTRVGELGYVWVSIECLTEKGVQKIPKVKIREDHFMSSMHAYFNGTSISDDAAELGNTDVNLSITSILFALIEDSYVVMEPEQMEITSSNETLQNLFKVKGLIGNIRANAGFRQRVSGLENIKNEYGMYQVGQFEDMESPNPYVTVLHDTIPVYFYDDYSELYHFLDYDFRVDPITGVIQMYRKGGQVEIAREDPIQYAGDSFYNNEDDNNQDVSQVKFRIQKLPFIYMVGEKYCYIDYEGNEVVIDEASGYLEHAIQVDGSVITYVKYAGLRDKVYWLGGTKYCYFDESFALTDEKGDYVYLLPRSERDMLFEYDLLSIEITKDCKEQYAPRINGSFMGEIRRYILRMTDAGYSVTLGSIIELVNADVDENGTGRFYCDEDRENKIQIYDEDGVLIGEPDAPIGLYVMEPSEPLADMIDVNMQVGGAEAVLALPAAFDIDWDSVTLKGLMTVTEVTVAPGTMGEATFPVRIIVTNREISKIDVTTVFTENSEKMTQDVPVVDAIDVDPYDFILAKNEFFMDIRNFNPENYSRDNGEYLTAFRAKEKEFINLFFSNKRFTINFDYENSNLALQNVKEEYWAKSFDNIADKELFDWNFDAYEGGNNLESMITTDGVVLYLHTYFRGQLIALRVNFQRRKLVLVHFGENDTFGVDKNGNIDPSVEEVNAGLDPSDAGYIFGQYVANYFDEETYTLPDLSDVTRIDNLIFIFLDENGRYVEKRFDFSYINGLKDNGNYNSEHYVLTWGDPVIKHIGSNGSYHYKKYIPGYYKTERQDGEGNTYVTVDGVEYKVVEFTDDETGATAEYLGDADTGERVLFNRPFDEWVGLRDENGTVIEEYDPIEEVDTDVTSTSINWIDVFAIYKNAGDDDDIKINLISGDSTYSGFMSSIIRITVKCPPLQVALSEKSEYDTLSGEFFTPSLVQIGSNTKGYYDIDPLVESTKEIPTTATIDFKNVNNTGAGISRHTFTNIKWYARFVTEEVGEGDDAKEIFTGRYDNAKGEVILKEIDGRYYFNTEDISLDKPFMTQIVARIGSATSGYQQITLCINILSKEPQHVDFYTGTTNNAKKIDSIERTDINLKSDGDRATAFAFYTYYVNTFDNFALPDFVRATLGSGDTKRTMDFNVQWRLADAAQSLLFAPNSIMNLIATIGDEDTLDVYLSVVVANYTIYEMSIMGDVGKAYVRVGNDGDLVRISDLLQYNVANGKSVGLYLVGGGVTDGYIRISTGKEGVDGDVPAGMIGLYEDERGEQLIKTVYPYDFIKEVYGRLSLNFNTIDENGNVANGGKPVDLLNLDEYYAIFVTARGSEKRVDIKDAVSIGYTYNVNNARNELNITFLYVEDGTEYYPKTEDGLVELNKTGGGATLRMTVNELAIHYAYATLGKDFANVDYYETALGVVSGENKPINWVRNGDGEYVICPIGSDEPIEGIEKVYFADGTVATYREVLWQKEFREAHRKTDFYVLATEKTMGIDNLEGIFYINDVIDRDGSNYQLIMGTGRGSYDINVRLHFIGGYKMLKDTDESNEIFVYPYSAGGLAQYGTDGYVMSEEISTRLEVENQGNYETKDMDYGLAYVGSDLLQRWYVEDLNGKLFNGDGAEINVGDFITVVPQSVVYSLNYGELTVSTLTKEGFRIRRKLIFSGRAEEVTSFHSMSGSASLVVTSGKIRIRDIYDYVPLRNYFANTAMLPASVSVKLGGGQPAITVNGVQWVIDDDWRSRVTDRMTFQGTQDSEFIMATAQVLGWDEITEEGLVKHDTITLKLRIEIDSAEAGSLPWSGGRLNLDTTPIKKAVEAGAQPTTVFAVEVDAFNDMSSSAVRNDTFVLPTTVSIQYKNGIIHTFDLEQMGVNFTYGGVPVTSIPYNIRGIDLDALVSEYPALRSVERDLITLTLDVGLQQNMVFEFRFYDKTVESVTPLIELGDKQIRETISTAMSAVSARKVNAVVDSINRTRIRANLEEIVKQATAMRDCVYKNYPYPTAAEIAARIGNVDTASAEMVADMLKGGWLALEPYEDDDGMAIESVDKNNVKTNVYREKSLYNFILAIAKDTVERLSADYGASVLRALKGGDGLNAATYQLENYKNQVQNEVFNTALGNYLKVELTALFEKDVLKMSGEQFAYTSAYKNAVEAAFDYDSVIREIYRIRELTGCGIYNPNGAKAAYIKLIEDALEAAKAAAKRSVSCSAAITTVVDGIIDKRLGKNAEAGGIFTNDDYTVSVENFVDYHIGGNKTQLRKDISSFITEIFDLNRVFAGLDDTVSHMASYDDDIAKIIEEMVFDNVNSIERFDSTVALIRSNIMTSVDVSTQLQLLIERAVENYVDGIYMESAVAREIKKVQALNLSESEDGYYVIDPYYEYRIVPTKLIVNFAENGGGFAYTFTARWTVDAVSDSVNYSGNRRNDLYGYVYTYYEASQTYGCTTEDDLDKLLIGKVSEASETYSGNTKYLYGLLVDAFKAVEWIKDDAGNTGYVATWQSVKDKNESSEAYSTLLILETLVDFFYDNVTADNRAELIMKLYLYYLAGNVLVNTDDETLAGKGIDCAKLRRDYDKYRLNEVTASLFNTNTQENQTVSLIIEVKNQSKPSYELVLKNSNGDTVPDKIINIENPFDDLIEDKLPQYAEIDGELLPIIWNSVSVTPLGNLNSDNHTVRGNIHNANGQEVTLELYVARWEYAGVYSDGKLKSPMNFFFSNSLSYSAEESYEIRFKVYTYGSDEVQYKSLEFYPEDSEALVDDTDDESMQERRARRRHVIYWDASARNRVLANMTSGIEGDVEIGNDSIGQFRLTAIAGGGNDNIPSRAKYNYDGIDVNSLALVELLEDGELKWQYGKSGEVTIAVDPYETLPETGNIRLNISNIKYDMNEIEVRLLWNSSYSTAIYKLKDFVATMIPDVETAAREQYAVSILMDWNKRSDEENADLLAKAKEYVNDRNLGEPYTPDQLTREAEQLLMINERFDYSSRTNVSKLKGGASGGQSVTVLVRYKGSEYIYEKTMLVRMLFADYSPIRYYHADASSDYAPIGSVTENGAPKELYIEVKTEYWLEDEKKPNYSVSNPYVGINDKKAYTMLEEVMKKDNKAESQIKDGKKLIKVTGIEYEDSANLGVLYSKSFVIDGVRYESGLIGLPVINGGN